MIPQYLIIVDAGYVAYINVWLRGCLCDGRVRHEKYFLLRRNALYGDAFITSCCFLFEFLMKRWNSDCLLKYFLVLVVLWFDYTSVFVILSFQWLCWNREGLSDAYSRDPRGRVRTQIISFFAYNKTNSIFNIFYVLAFKWKCRIVWCFNFQKMPRVFCA